jgi:NADP-dependent 3-hydroxy acid dehydrogenase YdfG
LIFIFRSLIPTSGSNIPVLNTNNSYAILESTCSVNNMLCDKSHLPGDADFVYCTAFFYKPINPTTMAGKLTGKVAIVTGASAGIGREAARALAAEGAQLVLTARREERLKELAAEINASGTKAVYVVGDAGQEETAKRTISAAIDNFGRIDILLNNAGMGIYKNLVDTSLEDYDTMMDTNMRSGFLFTRHAVPHMIKQGEGTILMLSSMAGIYGFAGEAVYCSTKFAQVGFAQALDKELRPKGIKVGAICPGGVKTEFALGTGRTEEGVAKSGMLEASDVAGAVLLACTQSSNSRIIEIQMRTMAEALT